MQRRGRYAVPLVLTALVATSLLACGGGSTDRVFGGDDSGTDTGGIDSTVPIDTGGGTDSGKDDGVDTNVDSGADTFDSGPPDTALPDTGPPTDASLKTVVAPVAGGTVSESATYRLITTHGQIAGGTVLSSGSYTLKGGVVTISQP